MEYINVVQLNENNKVIAVSQLKRDGYLPASNMIEISEYNVDLLDMQYDPQTQQFI